MYILEISVLAPAGPSRCSWGAFLPWLYRAASCGRRCGGGRRRLSHRQEESGPCQTNTWRSAARGEFGSGLVAAMGSPALPSLTQPGLGFDPTALHGGDNRGCCHHTKLRQPPWIPIRASSAAPESTSCEGTPTPALGWLGGCGWVCGVCGVWVCRGRAVTGQRAAAEAAAWHAPTPAPGAQKLSLLVK